MQLLVQSPGKFLCVVWNLVRKTFPKFITLRLFFKIFKKVKRKFNFTDSEKSINLLKIKKG